MKLSKGNLVAELRYILNHVESGDSFEGSISYSCMDDDLKQGEYRLVGTVRTGNQDGQGNVRIYPDDSPKDEENSDVSS